MVGYDDMGFGHITLYGWCANLVYKGVLPNRV